MIDTTKLMEAHAKVVDLAHREATARDEMAALRKNAEAAQADIDAIAEQLIAAASSPAEAGSIAAVADAISPIAALEPAHPVTDIDAALAAMAANAPQ
jgi:hypothetical protein